MGRASRKRTELSEQRSGGGEGCVCRLNRGPRQQGMKGQQLSLEGEERLGPDRQELQSKLQGTVMETSDRSQGGIPLRKLCPLTSCMVGTGVALGGETGRNRRTKSPEVKKQADRNPRRQKEATTYIQLQKQCFLCAFYVQQNLLSD